MDVWILRTSFITGKNSDCTWLKQYTHVEMKRFSPSERYIGLSAWRKNLTGIFVCGEEKARILSHKTKARCQIDMDFFR